MKRWLLGIVGVVAVIAVGGYVFREPLLNAMFERMTADMFVAQDADAYDPGLAVGTHVPQLRALYEGRDLTSIGTLTGTKGLALFVVRSVDW